MTHSHLLLWLEGPLQSWGHDSRFGRRSTLNFPTKSGVIGILCAALGAGGEQRELLAQLAALTMHIRAFPRKGRNNTCVQTPLLSDFQVVGNGYNDKDPWQSLFIPKTSEGKKAVGGGSKLTYRDYLQDMAFAVILATPEPLKDTLVQALIAPVWDLSLGRKCCVPSEFIYQEAFSTQEQAIEYADTLASEKGRMLSFSVVEGVEDGDEVMTLNDVPIQFGDCKIYRDRQVTVYYPE